jgi:hypothetical protein
MSPEQLQGGPLDFRTDLFSFGVVLYEMASGRHPFQESTAAGTTAGILRSEPPRLSGSDPLSSGLDRIIRRCLRKTPEERYRTTADLVGDLRSLSTIPPRRDSAPARVPGRELPGYWWAFHQGAVVLLYAAMALSLMGIRNEGAVAVAAYFGIVICASANGIMRIHLLFTSRFNPGAVVGELVRVSPWIRRADWLFSVCIAGAALTLFPRLQLIASLLVAVAIGYLVVFLVIEPATVKAVFPDRNPSDGGA